ncbi:phage tail sheath subtilisin-like domain-containing protein [Actinoplanes aureus]|uniref:Phage tail sheath family protein n=1 Tax=Actinoplanes aureus TaxID=2792083 RepID=A0A931C3S9_9ACTN|nr:phage tail sheath subtilisin-like domain-containing protein [Actinoplanes aureus]MBG0562854.1 phage tail sheath family protein [Actinoplanes aureus]
MTTELLPGLRVSVTTPEPEPDPARTDVAALLGGFRRGPVGTACRVRSWTEAQQLFGSIDGRHRTPYAVRGFFANGGRTAWLIRIGGAGAATASATWTVAARGADGEWPADTPARGGFRHSAYRIEATSPGAWANQTRVSITFRASSVAGPPVVSLRVLTPGEPAETFAEVPPADVVERLTASRLIRLVPAPGSESPGQRQTGPLTRRWDLTLGATRETAGADPVPAEPAYREAFAVQSALPEPALVAIPDLGAHFTGAEQRRTLVRDLLAEIAPLNDRLAVLDVTAGEPASADGIRAWLAGLTSAGERDLRRSAAVYHPEVRVPDPADPLGGLRSVPASGHVTGLIARLDAERGAHHTPANAALLEVVDLAVVHPEEQEALLFGAGVNLLRAPAGRGPLVWGGRTLAVRPPAGGDPDGTVPDDAVPGVRFIAHRRLVHLLVRAARRVAEPLIFEVNGPELRFALVRGITSVLLAAYRSGALAGNRPEEAFAVVCDERNNPPDADPATVVCDIGVAPANPMEFIDIRLVLGQDRALEVIEQ